MLPDGLWRIVRIGVVGLVLAAVAAGLVLGNAWLWVAVEWSPPIYAGMYESDGFDAPTTVTLLGAALVKAEMLWLILRAPKRGPLNRREKALRWLLYLAVAHTLVLWIPIGMLPDVVDDAFTLALWIAIDVLYLLVIRWRSRVLRTVAGAVFAVTLAGSAGDLFYELDLLGPGSSEIAALVLGLGLLVAGVAGAVVTVLGQRRDGRWSRGTLTADWLSAGYYALVIPINSSEWLFGGTATLIMMDVAGLVSAVWLAATAREMPADGRPEGVPPAQRRLPPVVVAAVAVLPLIVLIRPEQAPHLTYTSYTDVFTSCRDRPAFGDLKPSEREAAFLCRARSTDYGIPPLFPDRLSDQEILAYGRELCRAKDLDEQKAILTRAGSERPDSGLDPYDLVYVCPEVVGAAHPELLQSSAEREAADAAYIAEENAKCRDPWPRTKGVVQATTKYFLFADGDYGYLVHDPDDETADGEAERVIDRFDDDIQIGVSESAVLVGHVADVIDLCLTVKAFRAPPPRRTAGWDRVTEVPVISRSGRLTVPEMDGGEVGAGAPMPNLAIRGEGRYRLRVHVRVDEAGAEQHLVVVFPGTSRKKLKLSRER
ncbi:hypothetical protein AB0K60_13100 [Thermopolyspora sp. NPDC052614]|uniref:hypothetical protein n=1 Tax=Thermopolyspora sp. NPDC052614 TaxID=3155682 RepID=UPI003419FD6F